MKTATSSKLKSQLKGKVRLSEALVITFLITGTLGYSADDISKTNTPEQTKVISNERVSFVRRKISHNVLYRGKVEMYGEITPIREEKSNKILDHILQTKPKYLSRKSIDEKLQAEIEKNLREKINNLSQDQFTQELEKYYKENCLLEQVLYNGNGETVEQYLGKDEIKEFDVTLNKVAYIPKEASSTAATTTTATATVTTTATAVAAVSTAGFMAWNSTNDTTDNSSTDSSAPADPSTNPPVGATSSRIWVDGVIQGDIYTYTNPTDNTLTTTGGNHGLRSSGSNTEIINEGIIVVQKSTSLVTSGSDSDSTIDFDSGAIVDGRFLNYTFGMVGDNGTSVINKGNITIDNSIRSDVKVGGIYVDGEGTVGINQGVIRGNNVGGPGLAAENSATVINEGTVEHSSSNNPNYFSGMYASGVGSTAINKGTINIIGDQGMVAEDGIIINEGIIDSAVVNEGMVAKGTSSVAINKGVISISGNNAMHTDTGGILINENTGTISMSQSGMAVYNIGSVAINYGAIYGDAQGMIAGDGATVINEEGALISNIGVNIDLSESSTGINKGTITARGRYTVWEISGGSNGTNESTGIIDGIGSTGMFVSNTGSIGTNHGSITADVPMIAQGGGTIINDEDGTLISTASNGVLMSVDGSGSTAINKGTLDINAANSTGMVATNGATIINEGEINVNATSGTAMSVEANSTLVNEGEINLNSTNGVGIRVAGANATVQNNGTIYIQGTEVSSTDPSAITADSNGNQAIYIEEGASFVNNGEFIVDGDLNSNDMGEGDFVVAGGTVEADTISGDYYASGALAMGGYDDEYTTYQMFKTENMYGEINSNSAMFDAKLTEQDENGYYGIDMVRKDFNDIIDNDSYGKYLEDNYTTENDSEAKEDLYDAYKLVVTEDQLNKEVEETFGNTIYPSLMYQTLGIIRNNNQNLKNEAFKSTKEDIRYIGYGNYQDSEVEMDGNLSDYDSNLSSVSLGFDKAITETTRVGLVGTIGKADYDFDLNSDSREDDIYQLNLIGSYEKNDIKATATAYIGKTTGDLDRTLAVTSVYEEMNGNLENNYYGLDLSLEKKYELSKFNLTPRMELNMVNVKQESVEENGVYALDVDSINSQSVEGGVGFKIDRTIAVSNGVKIVPEASAMYYKEFANPYEETDAVLSSVSADKVEIDAYEGSTDRGVFEVALNAERNSLGARIGVQYKIDDQGEEMTPYVGVGYRF